MSFIYLDPSSEPVSVARSLAPRFPRAAEGNGSALVLGVLDNGKPNAGALLLRVAELLRAQDRIADVVNFAKPSAYRIAPELVLDDVARRCHLLLTGVGD